MKNINKIILIVVIIMMIISGCGNNAKTPDDIIPPSPTIINTDVPEIPTEETKKIDVPETTDVQNNETAKNTLNITCFSEWNSASLYASSFMLKNPGTIINIHVIPMERIATQFMAGTADDLIYQYDINFKDPGTVKLLADYYPIMRADPEFNEDDYYMNVFEAMSYEGGLYVFPLFYNFKLIAVNNRVSDELTQKFLTYDTVSVYDLMELRKNTPDAEKYYLYTTFDAREALHYEKTEFVDYKNRTCDFLNPRFIDLITDAKDATIPDKVLGFRYFWEFVEPKDEAENSQKYLFQEASNHCYQYYILGEDQVSFSHPVPLTNSRGELFIEAIDDYCLNAKSQNKELAWKFLKHLMSPETYNYNSPVALITNISVYKPLLPHQIKYELPKVFRTYEGKYGWRVDADIEQSMEEMIARQDAFGQMPMFTSFYGKDSYLDYVDMLTPFHNGQQTAEQAASVIQNKVSLMLTE